MYQNDANARQVELKPIIKEVAEEVVGKWENASIPCWGVIYTTKYIEKWGNETKHQQIHDRIREGNENKHK